MKRINFIIICLVMLSLLGCNKTQEIASLKITIEGTVYDYATNSLIAEATVTLNTSGNTYTATTDEYGFFTLGDFPAGSYTVVITKTGYQTALYEIASEDENITDYTESVVVNQTCQLYPLSVSISITVYKWFIEVSPDVNQAAGNVAYDLYINNMEVTSGTTDANGLLTEDNLPYNTYVYLEFDFEEDDIRYKTRTSVYTGSTSTNSITLYGYYNGADLGVVSTTVTNSFGDGVDDFAVSDDIVLNFTVPIDTAMASFSVYDYTDGYLTFTEIWSNSNMKVTLSPDSDLTSDEDARVYFYVEDESNYQNLSDYIYFKTAE